MTCVRLVAAGGDSRVFAESRQWWGISGTSQRAKVKGLGLRGTPCGIGLRLPSRRFHRGGRGFCGVGHRDAQSFCSFSPIQVRVGGSRGAPHGASGGETAVLVGRTATC